MTEAQAKVLESWTFYFSFLAVTKYYLNWQFNKVKSYISPVQLGSWFLLKLERKAKSHEIRFSF